MNTLKTEKRNMQVKAKRLRREGFVTGNIIGKEIDGSIPVQIPQLDAEKLIKSGGKGSQVKLDVDGQIYNTLIKDVDYNALRHQIYEIDFQALVAGEKVNSVAEIILLNQDMINTGVLERPTTEIAYRAVPDALVEKVEVDAGRLKLGDNILVKDLEIASNKDIEILTDLDAVVATVSAVKEEPTPETDEDAAVDTEAAPEA